MTVYRSYYHIKSFYVSSYHKSFSSLVSLFLLLLRLLLSWFKNMHKPIRNIFYRHFLSFFKMQSKEKFLKLVVLILKFFRKKSNKTLLLRWKFLTFFYTAHIECLKISQKFRSEFIYYAPLYLNKDQMNFLPSKSNKDLLRFT